MNIIARTPRKEISITIPKEHEKTAKRWLECMAIAGGDITEMWPEDVISFEMSLYAAVDRLDPEGVAGQELIHWFLEGDKK